MAEGNPVMSRVVDCTAETIIDQDKEITKLREKVLILQLAKCEAESKAQKLKERVTVLKAENSLLKAEDERNKLKMRRATTLLMDGNDTGKKDKSEPSSSLLGTLSTSDGPSAAVKPTGNEPIAVGTLKEPSALGALAPTSEQVSRLGSMLDGDTIRMVHNGKNVKMLLEDWLESFQSMGRDSTMPLAKQKDPNEKKPCYICGQLFVSEDLRNHVLVGHADLTFKLD